MKIPVKKVAFCSDPGLFAGLFCEIVCHSEHKICRQGVVGRFGASLGIDGDVGITYLPEYVESVEFDY